MEAFEFRDYKTWINDLIRSKPRNGHGQYRELARVLDTSSAVISQVFKGSRDLNLEQAHKLCGHFDFSKSETEYFLLLVQKDRAGTRDLQKWFEEKLEEMRAKARELKNRLPRDQVLTPEAKAVFYSHWYYSGVRLLSSVPGYQDIDAIADYFKLPRAKVQDVAAFLLRHGLCEEDNGKLRMGPKRTHLEADSPLVNRHHQNWRTKAIVRMEAATTDDLFYTGPMSLSHAAIAQIRKDLVAVIEKVRDLAVDAPEETLACLNVDWFEFR